MENQNNGQTEAQTEVDPWAAAFAALDKKNEEDSQEPPATGASDDNGSGADAQESGVDNSGEAASDNGTTDEGTVGGLDPDANQDGGEAHNAFESVASEEEIEQFKTQLSESNRQRAIDEVAAELLKRDNIRSRDGVLGASLDDPDICKRDSDGIPHFFNPETGREFTGDNPRRQAQEWVDDYNNALAKMFNKTCADYEKYLNEQSAPQLKVMEFAPKYDKLDRVRRGMLDNIIEDYEIKDSNGSVIGYNCDLDKALAAVERQIKMIQDYVKTTGNQQQQKPTGPALDMKTSSGAVPAGNESAPTSLAEAMERIQNRELEKLKRKGN